MCNGTYWHIIYAYKTIMQTLHRLIVLSVVYQYVVLIEYLLRPEGNAQNVSGPRRNRNRFSSLRRSWPRPTDQGLSATAARSSTTSTSP